MKSVFKLKFSLPEEYRTLTTGRKRDARQIITVYPVYCFEIIEHLRFIAGIYFERRQLSKIVIFNKIFILDYLKKILCFG